MTSQTPFGHDDPNRVRLWARDSYPRVDVVRRSECDLIRGLFGRDRLARRLDLGRKNVEGEVNEKQNGKTESATTVTQVSLR